MIYENWLPTMELRWSVAGKLQQEWRRNTIEYRCYNGNPVPRQCTGSETEWRDISSETVSGSTP